jgi:hypothetical protein
MKPDTIMDEAWMKQIARNVTMDEWGFLGNCRYLIPGEAGQALHDRDTKYCQSFLEIIESSDVKPLRLIRVRGTSCCFPIL